MKKLLKLILISAIFVAPATQVKAADNIAEDLFETKFKDEIILDTNSNISSSKTTNVEVDNFNAEKIAIESSDNSSETTTPLTKKLFNIPAKYQPELLLPIGYIDRKPSILHERRKKIEELVEYNEY